MGKKYDVVAVTGTYNDSQGNEKKRFLNIGVVLEKDGKFYLKLEAIPTGWDGFASLYVPQEKDANTQRNNQAQERANKPQKPQGSFNDMDDSIPF